MFPDMKFRENCGLRQFNWTSFSFTTTFRHLAKRPLQVHFRGGSSWPSYGVESETSWGGSPEEHWTKPATGLVWLHLTADYFASIAVEPVGPWQTSNLQQCFVWTAESVLPSTLCWLMLAWATSAGRHWRILPHLTDHSQLSAIFTGGPACMNQTHTWLYPTPPTCSHGSDSR